MPYINVRILSGATATQKRAVVADITKSMVERLGKSPEHIHIVIDEISPENWGFAGQLTQDLAAQHGDAAQHPRPTSVGSRSASKSKVSKTEPAEKNKKVRG